MRTPSIIQVTTLLKAAKGMRDEWTLEKIGTLLWASYKLTRVLHPTMLQQIVPFPLAAPNKLPNYGVPERLFPSKIKLERFPESLYAARYEHSLIIIHPSTCNFFYCSPLICPKRSGPSIRSDKMMIIWAGEALSFFWRGKWIYHEL